ncbi:RNA polymerase sigma-70 factor [Dyadobacter frigoris]|uniref:RNA polymerase sigma-70 factor n=1 Tax=Dyadobacter frigoris TaxID=2576211 RepID=UPI001485B3AA|nr:RNA polymerase sigma-70 factor [Dyadobacter frigoris]
MLSTFFIITLNNSHKADEELFSGLKLGDRDAFAQLYKKYWRRLFDSAYKRLLLREECEEMIQELFVDLWTRRNTLILSVSLEAYLFGALRYSIYNLIRSRKIKEAYLDHLLHTPAVGHNYIEDQLYYEELAEALQKSIEKLPEKFRRVYILSRRENLCYKEIAVQLNIPIDTVEKHMGKALKILREDLKDFALVLLILANLH